MSMVRSANQMAVVAVFLALLALLGGCSIFDPSSESTPTRDRLGPTRVRDLRVESVNRVSDQLAQVCLTWTAPGDDGDEGIAASYEFAYTPEAFELQGWDTTNEVPVWGYWVAKNPKPGGQREVRCWTLRVPVNLMPFYVAMRATDNVGNIGDVSNIVIIR